MAGGTLLGLILLALAGLAFKLPGAAGQADLSPGNPQGAAGQADHLPPKDRAAGQADHLPPKDGTEGRAGAPAGNPPAPDAAVERGDRTRMPQPGGAAGPQPPTTQPFTPIQIEAEDARNSVTGAAERVSYATASGGVLVRGIGNPRGGSVGALTVPVSVPDTGDYQLLIRIAVPDGPATLTLVVTVSGSVPLAVPVTGRSSCCGNGSATIGLQAGTNWVSFGNPTDRGPAIDFIQITRPGK